MAEFAQPHHEPQQILQDDYGDEASAEAKVCQLGAVVQGTEEGTELGTHNPTLIQIQILEGG